MRTYLYPSDILYWLFAIIYRGKGNQTLNVGSKYMVSIQEVAALVRSVALYLMLKELPLRYLVMPLMSKKLKVNRACDVILLWI